MGKGGGFPFFGFVFGNLLTVWPRRRRGNIGRGSRSFGPGRSGAVQVRLRWRGNGVSGRYITQTINISRRFGERGRHIYAEKPRQLDSKGSDSPHA